MPDDRGHQLPAQGKRVRQILEHLDGQGHRGHLPTHHTLAGGQGHAGRRNRGNGSFKITAVCHTTLAQIGTGWIKSGGASFRGLCSYIGAHRMGLFHNTYIHQSNPQTLHARCHVLALGQRHGQSQRSSPIKTCSSRYGVSRGNRGKTAPSRLVGAVAGRNMMICARRMFRQWKIIANNADADFGPMTAHSPERIMSANALGQMRMKWTSFHWPNKRRFPIPSFPSSGCWMRIAKDVTTSTNAKNGRLRG